MDDTYLTTMKDLTSSNRSMRTDGEGITVENMALLCSRNLKLKLPPIELPDLSPITPTVSELIRGGIDEISLPPVEPPPPPEPEPCIPIGGRTMVDNPDYFWGSTLGPDFMGDETLTSNERQWLSRYACLDRERMAELREAFLLFATNAPATTLRAVATAAAGSGVEDLARLSLTDVGRCLRVVGQNPTQADIDRITAAWAPPLPPSPAPSLGLGGAVPTVASNRALLPATAAAVTAASRKSTKPPSPRPSAAAPATAATPAAASGRKSSGAGRRQTTALPLPAEPASAVPSAEQAASTIAGVPISMDEFLKVANQYGKFQTADEQLDDLVNAYAVFDELREGTIDVARLRTALTSLGEPLTDDDVDAMLELVADQISEDGMLDYKLLVDKLVAL